MNIFNRKFKFDDLGGGGSKIRYISDECVCGPAFELLHGVWWEVGKCKSLKCHHGGGDVSILNISSFLGGGETQTVAILKFNIVHLILYNEIRSIF